MPVRLAPQVQLPPARALLQLQLDMAEASRTVAGHAIVRAEDATLQPVRHDTLGDQRVRTVDELQVFLPRASRHAQ
ncbi:hypothetical protein GCM10008026_15850 [Chelatococcus composti]|nr:hypothetical protein GCM10008026_15850 [Chelatococcus composti]